MKKPMLKPAFAALTVGLGLAAFADVQLANNAGTITWDAFVAALNGGVKGDVKNLPDGDIKDALVDADKALTAANTTLQGFTDGKTSYNTAVTNAENYLNSFNSKDYPALYANNQYAKAIATAQTYLDSFDPKNTEAYANNQYAKAVKDAEAEVAKLNGAATIEGSIAEAEAALATAADTAATHNVYYNAMAGLNDLKAQYAKNSADSLKWEQDKAAWSNTLTNTLPGLISNVQDQLKDYEHTSTVTTPVAWLNTIYGAAKTFYNAYTSWTNYEGSKYVNKGTVYYRYVSKSKTLNLAFGAEPETFNADGDADTWLSINEEDFWTKFSDSENTTRTVVSVLNVYLGSGYENGETIGQSSGYLNVGSYTSSALYENIIPLAYNAIKDLTNTPGYYKSITNTTYEVPADNTDPNINAENLKALLDELDGYNTQKSTLAGNIKNADIQIADLKADNVTLAGQIKGYKYEAKDAETEGEYVGQSNTVADWKTIYDAKIKTVTDAQEEVEKRQAALETAEAAVTAANATFTTEKGKAQDALDSANTTFTTEEGKAQEALKAAEEALGAAKSDATTAQENAQTAYDRALRNAQAEVDRLALLNYQEVHLTADVVANTAITKTYSGTIWGNNHVITLDGPTYIFSQRFNGELVNAAVNGAFASSTSGATFENVAYWPGGNAVGKYYNTDGTPTEYKTIDKLGYAVRGTFGVNFAGNKLAFLADDTKVYYVTVNNSTESNVPKYVTINEGAFVTTGGVDVTIPVNHFAFCADEDIAGKNAPANVYYGTAGNYTCDNATVIADKVGNEVPEFYAPVNMNVKSVTITRSFKKGYNSVCLPFEFSKSDADGISALCTYDSETSEKFFFQIQEDAIPANTPFLMITNKEVKVTEPIKDVTIKATPAKMYVSFEGLTPDDLSFGTFNKLNATNFLDGAQGSYKIYGLNGDKFQAAGTNATFSAFRMAIRSELVASQQEADQAPRRIALLDSRGIEIGSGLEGIEGVESGSSLDIATGVGEIIFTSEADYGKVEVYSIDGRVVAVADVMAGTSSVNVAKGVYIVMGKKVMVK